MIHDLLDSIDAAIAKISMLSGVTLTPANAYWPLRKVDGFTKSKGRWFPKDRSRPPVSAMPADVWFDVRAALLDERGPDGSAILNDRDREDLDATWEKYVSDIRDAHKVRDVVAKGFFHLIRPDIDLGSPLGYDAFLRRNLLEPMYGNDYVRFSKNIAAIESGIENRFPGIKINAADIAKKRDLFLVQALYCLYRLNHPKEAEFAKRIHERLKQDPQNEVLLQGRWSYEYFHHFDPVSMKEAVSVALKPGRKLNLGATGPDVGIILSRSARLAIDYGFRLSDQPEFLNGISVSDALKKAETAFMETGRGMEANMTRTIVAIGHADEGSFDQMADELAYVDRQSDNSAQSSPFRKVMHTIVEIRGFCAASKGEKNAYLYGARKGLMQLEELLQKSPTTRVNSWDKRFIEKITRLVIDKYGILPHLNG